MGEKKDLRRQVAALKLDLASKDALIERSRATLLEQIHVLKQKASDASLAEHGLRSQMRDLQEKNEKLTATMVKFKEARRTMFLLQLQEAGRDDDAKTV